MAGETPLTIIGNLTADPELSFTQGSGDAVSNFTVASTPRTFDRQSNEWKDGETLFMRCSAWRELGQNVADSLQKGMRVIVTGVLKSRKFQTKEGENRTVIELEVHEIGPSLKYASAVVTRTQSNNQQGGGFGGGQQGQGGFGGGQQGNQQGGTWGGQQAGAQQGGQWGGQQTQQGGGQWGGQQGQHNAQHYQQAAANGPQAGGQPAAAEDPWATPGVTGQQGGNWNQSAAQQAVTAQAQGQYQPQGGQPQGNGQEPPF
jgi:single-strand DNA-binding protein